MVCITQGRTEFYQKNSHPVKVLPSIVGYIEKIPDDILSSFKEIWTFKKTDSCLFDRVMLGATWFANHCWRPNCRYILRNLNSRRCIQLEVLKPIDKKDEITVFYGANFFGEGNQDCLCVNVDLHEQKATPFQSVSISRQRLVLRPVCIRPQRKSVLRTKRRKTSPQSKFEMRRFLLVVLRTLAQMKHCAHPKLQAHRLTSRYQS